MRRWRSVDRCASLCHLLQGSPGREGAPGTDGARGEKVSRLRRALTQWRVSLRAQKYFCGSALHLQEAGTFGETTQTETEHFEIAPAGGYVWKRRLPRLRVHVKIDPFWLRWCHSTKPLPLPCPDAWATVRCRRPLATITTKSGNRLTSATNDQPAVSH